MMNLKNFLINLLMISFAFSSIAEEKVYKDQNTEFSLYTGMFDFSDDGKKSTLIGFQPVSYTHLTLPTTPYV